MEKKLSLKSVTRNEKPKVIRDNGFIPAIFYGKNKKSESIQVEYHDFRRTFENSGYNTIIYLEIDDKQKVPVLVNSVDLDPVKDTFIHIDFYAVKMDQEISTTIPLKFVGSALAVKDLGGTLVHSRDELNVKCLPTDLIPEIEVDISLFTDFNISLSVKDLTIPETINVIDDPDTLIATVSAPRKEEEENPADKVVTEESAEESTTEETQGETDEDKS